MQPNKTTGQINTLCIKILFQYLVFWPPIITISLIFTFLYSENSTGKQINNFTLDTHGNKILLEDVLTNISTNYSIEFIIQNNTNLNNESAYKIKDQNIETAIRKILKSYNLFFIYNQEDNLYKVMVSNQSHKGTHELYNNEKHLFNQVSNENTIVVSSEDSENLVMDVIQPKPIESIMNILPPEPVESIMDILPPEPVESIMDISPPEPVESIMDISLPESAESIMDTSNM